MKALIDENGVVVQVEEQEFEIAFPCFWVECSNDVVAYEYKYENEIFVPISKLISVSTAEQNKTTAKQKLQDTDWTVLSDVNLANKTEWENYRAAIRAIARNPQEGEIDWPTRPVNDWS